MRRFRFIPACAGNSSRNTSATAPRPVHPRVCGELPAVLAEYLAATGSSPRVRGTRAYFEQETIVDRFIPACAGNSAEGWAAGGHQPVHPRVCGELGPPRGEEWCVNRFIPACAGNSLNLPAFMSRTNGSSPRVRGTRTRRSSTRGRRRFIPACAGNSRPPAVLSPSPSVHPRVCGELGGFGEGGSRNAGSSPRVRGTRSAGRVLIPVCRFIPACAGNSSKPNRPRRPPPVHPRVCGELAYGGVSIAVTIGSSPRVRGTLNGLRG